MLNILNQSLNKASQKDAVNCAPAGGVNSMKIFSIPILLILSACSGLSDIEHKILGYWEWELISGDFKESGFLDLRSDRSYGYEINHKNPIELLSEKYSHSELSYWRIKGGKVCTAKEWSRDSIFLKTEITKEICRWDVVVDSDGKTYLEIDSGFKNQKIRVARSAKI